MTNRFARFQGHGATGPLIRTLQLPPPAIQYLTAHLEASDGIGLARTLDESRGIVELWVMPDFSAEIDALMDWLAGQWPIQPLGREFE